MIFILLTSQDPAYQPPEPIQVFSGCAVDIAVNAQSCFQAATDKVAARGLMCIIAIGLTGISTFLPVFGDQQAEYWREASAMPQPRHTIAYFLGKDIAMLPQVVSMARVIRL